MSSRSQSLPAITIREHPAQHCWISGLVTKPDFWNAPWFPQIAHIASGSGVARRVDDRRAVILLCPLAHQCHVSSSDDHPRMHIGPREWPTFDERHTLWVKQKMDPEFFSIEFLQSIWVGKVPDPEPPPWEWESMYVQQTHTIRS